MSSLALLAPQQAHANSDEACETLMCMSGLVGNGSPKKTCDKPIDRYFSIIRFTFWGYSGHLTRLARERYLKSCQGSDVNIEWVAAIQAVYGEVP